MDDVYFVVRGANIIIGTIALAWIVWRCFHRRTTIPFELMTFFYVLGFFVLAGVEVSVEAMIYQQPYGIRSFLFLLGNVGVIVSLALTQNHRHLHIEAR